ncbi:MAG: nucleotide exchange factor GrpE [Candidatus Omnitrophica bacterium]|jgi:molecular chaperone GrpE|nr:nucleotide exchange factor GrpE [Candidatus Omnitrophota bacterium]
MIPREQEERETEHKESEEESIEVLKKILGEAEKKAEAYLSGWQRAQADFINYKHRIEQERSDFTKCANASLMLSLLPVLDDLDRAFASMPSGSDGLQWVEGFSAIERKFRKILESQGLTEIKAIGEPFDTQFHEAVLLGKGKEDIVVGEVQKGYRLHDKVLRPTKAIVGNGEGEEKEEKC